ncbi:MAG: hypothetical protein J0M18_15635 [Ignavibacteria bacterium]|nr:hypothetical protein [Ignavibacteria bacterium]
MKTLLIFGVLYFYIIGNSCGQSKSPDSVNLNIKIDLLSKKNQQLSDSLSILTAKFNNTKIDYDIVNQSLSASNSIVQWSGWIGVLITIIIVFFAFFSTVRSERTLKKVDERLLTAEKDFNDFINSPEKINDALERMNLLLTEKCLFSNDVKEVMEGLNKGYSLGRENKYNLAIKIKYNVFNSNLDPNTKFQLLFFILSNWSDSFEKQKYCLELYKKSDKEFIDQYFYSIIPEIFKSKPYPISIIDLVALLKPKSSSISILLNSIDLEEAKELFINGLKRKLDLTYVYFCSKFGVVESTKIVTNYFDIIEDVHFDEIKDSITYEKELVKKVFKKNSNLNGINDYIRKHVDDIEKFKSFWEVVDISIEKNWIEILKTSFNGFKEKDKIDFLKTELENKKNDLPDSEFFRTILPLLLSKNYGLTGFAPFVMFNGKILGSKKTVPFFGGSVRETVWNPILQMDVYL